MAESKNPEELTVDGARRWRLEAVSPAGDVIGSWPLLRCIAGQVKLRGVTYIVSDGHYFAISPDFLGELDDFIQDIPISNHPLPASKKHTSEGDYNKDAASSNDAFLLLDKRTVRISGKTSPIEICDILTADRAFIHVKRKLGSSSLSHLFAQGSVSADLLVMSKEYREKTLEMIRSAERERPDAAGEDSFVERFSRINSDSIQPQEFEVVYAVVAKWIGRKPKEALPFFSKVNLRRHVSDLKRMGYRFSFAPIEVT